MSLRIIQGTIDNLKSLSSSAVTFAVGDNSISATGIGTQFPTAGKKIVVSGAAQSGNNTTFTIESVSSADKIIVTETVTAESAGASVVINEEFQGAWKDISEWDELAGHIDASQNCTIYIDQGADNSNAGYTSSWSVTGGTLKGFSVETISTYGRLRIRNGGTDQTSMTAYMNGKKSQ